MYAEENEQMGMKLCIIVLCYRKRENSLLYQS